MNTQVDQTLGARVASMELLNLLSNVMTHADSSSERLTINAVKIWSDGGFIYAVATDRYRIMEGKIASIDGQGIAPILVSLKDIKRIIDLLKGIKLAGYPVSLHVAGDLGSLEVSGTMITFRGIDGAFPPYEHLFPTGEPVSAGEITLNPKLLGDYSKIVRKGNGITLRFFGDRKPVVIEGLPEGFRAIVMPMRKA